MLLDARFENQLFLFLFSKIIEWEKIKEEKAN